MAGTTTENLSQNQPFDNRIVRVFISSTFRDMHAERDFLVTVVFPELRERLDRLGLEFFDVDLRWGVPMKGEDNEETNSWEYCRKWINEAEPFFICMLGQRYGSLANEIKDEAEREEYSDLSVTEMEVRHAVFSGKIKKRSYFYFRDTKVPGNETITGVVYNEFVQSGKQRALRALKKNVAANSGRPVRHYSCRWKNGRFTALDKVKEGKQFGRMVLEDLWSGVLRDDRYVAKALWKKATGKDPDTDPLYTDESLPLPEGVWNEIVELAKPLPKNPLDRELEEMGKFAILSKRWFLGRNKELGKLARFCSSPASGDKRITIIRALPGQGKSALMAALYLDLKPLKNLLVPYFVGVTASSSSTYELVKRLLGELDRSGIDWPFEQYAPLRGQKTDFNSICLRLAHRLATYSGDRRIIILIDALDQLTDWDNLQWLPIRPGPGVRIIISCTDSKGLKSDKPGRKPMQALASHRRSLWQMQLGPLKKGTVRAIAKKYLEAYCHKLDTEYMDAICQLERATNPLYLLVMLDQLLKLSGNDLHRRIGEQLKLMPKHTRTLFEDMLDRLEAFGPDRVQQWCLYLAHGRAGMASRELADLLAHDFPADGRSAAFRIERGIRRYLQKRGAQLDFVHNELREAVLNRYGYAVDEYGPVMDEKTVHQRLARYFKKQPVSPRKATELPWQLEKAEQNAELKKQLLDIGMFSELFRHNKFELMHYWVMLKEERTMGAGYLRSFERWRKHSGDAGDVGLKATELYTFLNDASLFSQIKPLMELTLRTSELSVIQDDLKLATHKNNLAVLFKNIGKFEDAERLMLEALAIFKKQCPPNDARIGIQSGNLAMLLVDMGRWADAEPLIQEALQIDEENYDKDHPEVAIRLRYRAILLSIDNRWEEAKRPIERALRIDQQSYGKDYQVIADDVNILAQLFQNTGRFNEAKHHMLRAITINEKTYGKNTPNIAVDLNNLGQLFRLMGRFSDAEKSFQRALIIYKQNHDRDSNALAQVLNNMGGLLLEGDNRKLGLAKQYIMHALRLERKKRGEHHPDVATCLINLSDYHQAIGQPANAIKCVKEALKIDRESFNGAHPNIARDLGKLGILLLLENQVDEAAQYLQEALDINLRYYKKDHPAVAAALRDQAEFHLLVGEAQKATENIELALSIDRQYFDPDNISVAFDLNRLADLRIDAGKPDDAIVLLDENLAINRKISRKTPAEVAVSLVGLFALLMADERYAEAESYIQEALRIDTGCYNKNHIAVGDDLANYAVLLRKLKRLDEAERIMRRAVGIYKKQSSESRRVLPHLLNTLCTILVMLGKIDEATHLADRAWALKAGKHDLISARILFMQYTISLVKNRDAINHSNYLGKLKTLLANGALTNDTGVSETWDIMHFIEYISPVLPSGSVEFLPLLAGALNNFELVADLDKNEQWKMAAKSPY